WTDIVGTGIEMKLKRVRLDINAPALHESYHARWVNPREEDSETGEDSWSVAIPLVLRAQPVGRLEVAGVRDDRPVWKKIAVLTKHVQDLEQILHKIADDAGILGVHDTVSTKPISIPEVSSLDVSVIK